MTRTDPPRTDSQQQRSNLRLALVLFTVALAFGLGFVAKVVLFNH